MLATIPPKIAAKIAGSIEDKLSIPLALVLLAPKQFSMLNTQDRIYNYITSTVKKQNSVTSVFLFGSWIVDMFLRVYTTTKTSRACPCWEVEKLLSMRFITNLAILSCALEDWHLVSFFSSRRRSILYSYGRPRRNYSRTCSFPVMSIARYCIVHLQWVRIINHISSSMRNDET